MQTWAIRHLQTITQVVDITDDEDEVLIAECIKIHDAERIVELHSIFQEYAASVIAKRASGIAVGHVLVRLDIEMER